MQHGAGPSNQRRAHASRTPARQWTGSRRAGALAAVLLATALPAGAAAQQAQAPAPAEAQPDSPSRFAVGFQSAFPAYGISGMMDVGEHMSVQGVVGAFGTVSTFSGRGIYRFQENGSYNLYGFGTAGLWRWSSGSLSESSVGVGGGGGLELDWKRIFGNNGTDFPPLISSIDVGFTAASFDTYNFNALTFGAGFHYRF